LHRWSILNGPETIPGGQPPRNVMPSLHVAFALLGLTAAWQSSRRLFWGVLPLAFLLMVTTLTRAVHYLVDVIAAVPFATLVWWMADRATRWTQGGADDRLPELATPHPARRWLSIQFIAALGVSVAGWLWWAHHAPIAPRQAWAIVLVCAAWPAWAGWRMNGQRRVVQEPSRAASSACRFDARRSVESR
jgi:hypothetical protein